MGPLLPNIKRNGTWDQERILEFWINMGSESHLCFLALGRSLLVLDLDGGQVAWIPVTFSISPLTVLLFHAFTVPGSIRDGGPISELLLRG